MKNDKNTYWKKATLNKLKIMQSYQRKVNVKIQNKL